MPGSLRAPLYTLLQVYAAVFLFYLHCDVNDTKIHWTVPNGIKIRVAPKDHS